MSSCSQKVRFMLAQKGLDYENINVDLHGGENLESDFLKLNPKGVVPVLVDDEEVILESNNICIYLDEKYPENSLMPSTAKGRSDVRVLLQQIDENVHYDISACTYTIGFRPRLQKTYDTPEKLADYLASIPDAGKREFRKNIITKGLQSLEFEVGVKRSAAMIGRLDALLQNSDYLVGDDLSVADICYSPYITRLDHLAMSYIWQDKPAVKDWYARLQETEGYQRGFNDYFNEDVIAKMNAAGDAARKQMEEVLAK
ncbi:UNVERIFIED_CONTAM: hypothetical protein GTU68_009489 [Idotea baltica]|nr:hypothetical protein [Idotea baltica]